jgi:propane monooxygenase coupling protein
MLHEDNIFKSMKDIKFEDTVSHQCGVTMNDSVEARAIADVMSRHLFEISTSTHYGRMVMTDDNTVMLFGDMNEMMKYII